MDSAHLINAISFKTLDEYVQRFGNTPEEDFRNLTSNRLGSILAVADANSPCCMKFAHYLPVYTQLLAPMMNKRIRMLEIGVQHGGSYRLWRNFFGEDMLQWTGIDIKQECLSMNKRFQPENALVYCGSQSDIDFLDFVSLKRGKFDIIIDDGSHKSSDIIASFQTLAKYLKSDGLYIVEDLHACYWDGFDTSCKDSTAVSFFQNLVHSLNIQAANNARAFSSNSTPKEWSPPCGIKRIDFHQSMVVCYIGIPDPLIEWKAGSAIL